MSNEIFDPSPWTPQFFEWLASHHNDCPVESQVLRHRIDEALLSHIVNGGTKKMETAYAVFSDDEGLMWMTKTELYRTLKLTNQTRADAIRNGFLFYGEMFERL